MTAIARPSVTFNISPDKLTVENKPQRLLYVGQKQAGGTAVAGELITNIENDNSWDTLFGPKSMLAAMIRRARLVNGVTRLDAIALDDAAGAIANSTLTLTGSPTEDGSITVILGSQNDFSFLIDIVDADTPTTIGDKIEAAVNANTNVPISAANVAGVITFTYIHTGTEGNALTLAVTGVVGGLIIVTTAFTGGTTNPDTSTLFDVVGNTRYQTIMAPFAWGLTYLTDFLDPRFNVTNNILDGVAVVTAVDTFSNLEAIGNTQDSQSLVIFGDKLVTTAKHNGAAIIELSYVKSGEIGALRGLRLTEDADISEIVVSAGQLDSIGGAAIASLPYFNTPLAFISLGDVELGFDETEIVALTTAGISVIGNNIANTKILLGEVATTYKTDSAGNPDASFKFLNFVDTISGAREFMFNNFKSDNAQTRLTKGDLIALRAIENQTSLRALFVGYFTTLSEGDFVLTEAGEEALQFYKQNLTISVDLEKGRVIVTMRTPIVTQLRSLIADMQISFII